MNAPRFDYTINFGQVASIVAVMFTIAVAFGSLAYKQGQFETRTEERLNTTEELRKQYLPVVQAGISLQDVTNERLNNVAQALREVRGSIADNTTATGALAERVARIEAILPDKPQKLGYAQ